MNLVRKIADNYTLPYYTLSPTYSICKSCGYINGETYSCPTCGKETEIYSRITGYYRPLKNWNDGKVQEYKNRREYVYEGKKDKCVLTIDSGDTALQVSHVTFIKEESTGMFLFTTPSCPQCPSAKKLLSGISGIKEVNAREHRELTEKYKVMSVPTLIIDNNNRQEKYTGVEQISRYAKTI